MMALQNVPVSYPTPPAARSGTADADTPTRARGVALQVADFIAAARGTLLAR
jgi:hypothetical protein